MTDTAFQFLTPQIETPAAGERTAEVEGYHRTADGGYAHYRWEGAREDADAAVRELLATGLIAQVSIKLWAHQWNLPGALPAVRAHIVGMDKATLDAAGYVIREPVNIW
jgi:hypothetical protein